MPTKGLTIGATTSLIFSSKPAAEALNATVLPNMASITFFTIVYPVCSLIETNNYYLMLCCYLFVTLCIILSGNNFATHIDSFMIYPSLRDVRRKNA